jgi:RNA polymerase sigma-70 factor (ECF subfamily)
LALRVAQWTARILGTLLLLFYGTFIVAEGLPPIATQSVGVQLNFIALGLMLGGFAVGWKREGTAAILITSGWTLWHISEGRLDLNLFQTPLPVAALYGYCWWELRGRRTGVLAGTVAVLAVTLGLGRLLLPVNVFVHGVVTDATTGTPITNASLAIIQKAATDRESNELPNARTGITGRFRLHLGWYVAQQPVRIAAPGYSVLTTNLGPRALGARNVSRDFLMQPTGQSGDAGIRLPGPVPPVVLSTVPASGSRDVDPTLTELRVTFSKPMLDGHWAWCTLNDGSYPETTGASRFLNDERTCVLPVKLEPGRVYATWVNVDKFQGFKDQNGTPAVPYLLIFETRK